MALPTREARDCVSDVSVVRSSPPARPDTAVFAAPTCFEFGSVAIWLAAACVRSILIATPSLTPAPLSAPCPPKFNGILSFIFQFSWPPPAQPHYSTEQPYCPQVLPPYPLPYATPSQSSSQSRCRPTPPSNWPATGPPGSSSGCAQPRLHRPQRPARWPRTAQ